MEVHLCKILDLILFVFWWIRSLSEPTASSGCHNLTCIYWVLILILWYLLTCCSTGLYDVVKCDWFLECLVSTYVNTYFALIIYIQRKIFFRQSYSPCHYLEGIKDALSECSGLVRTVGLCAQAWWSWRCIRSADAQSALRSRAMLSGPPSLSLSERRGSLFSVIPILIVQ